MLHCDIFCLLQYIGSKNIIDTAVRQHTTSSSGSVFESVWNIFHFLGVLLFDFDLEPTVEENLLQMKDLRKLIRTECEKRIGKFYYRIG